MTDSRLPHPNSTKGTSDEMKKALRTIDIVDELIHSITRRHIPDYPEATIAINKIDKAIAQEVNKAVIKELKELESLPNVYPEKIDGQYTHVHAIYKSAITERIKALTAEQLTNREDI